MLRTAAFGSPSLCAVAFQSAALDLWNSDLGQLLTLYRHDSKNPGLIPVEISLFET
jgi:hypothetical protein